MCICDEHWRFLQAYMKRMHGTPAIAETEAMGINVALHWLWNNYREVAAIEVESGCLQVVQAINSKHTNNTELDSIIVMCQNLLFLNNNRK
ncbi:hypothetical protein A2U01_0040863, partial [Trifolium medium]|nr:hypothetical protein [Trifolium medium]